MTEKQQLDVSWGNLDDRAHAVGQRQGATSASVENLVGLHKDGWGGAKSRPARLQARSRGGGGRGRGQGRPGQAEATGKVAHIAAAVSAHGDPDAAGGERRTPRRGRDDAAGAAVHAEQAFTSACGK